MVSTPCSTGDCRVSTHKRPRNFHDSGSFQYATCPRHDRRDEDGAGTDSSPSSACQQSRPLQITIPSQVTPHNERPAETMLEQGIAAKHRRHLHQEHIDQPDIGRLENLVQLNTPSESTTCSSPPPTNQSSSTQTSIRTPAEQHALGPFRILPELRVVVYSACRFGLLADQVVAHLLYKVYPNGHRQMPGSASNGFVCSRLEQGKIACSNVKPVCITYQLKLEGDLSVHGKFLIVAFSQGSSSKGHTRISKTSCPLTFPSNDLNKDKLNKPTPDASPGLWKETYYWQGSARSSL